MRKKCFNLLSDRLYQIFSIQSSNKVLDDKKQNSNSISFFQFMKTLTKMYQKSDKSLISSKTKNTSKLYKQMSKTNPK